MTDQRDEAASGEKPTPQDGEAEMPVVAKACALCGVEKSAAERLISAEGNGNVAI